MRKSTLIAISIIVVALGAMMFAANWMLTPLKQDAEAAKEIQGELHNLGWLAEGTKVRARSLKGGDKGNRRLFREQEWGVLVILSPNVATFRSEGRLVSLAQRVVETVTEKGARGKGIRWVELALEYDGQEVIRGLYVLDPETGRWGQAPPGLPESWQPEGGFPPE